MKDNVFVRSSPENLWRRRHLLRELVLANLKRQNKNTVLGYLWWLLDPLLLTAVYYLVVAVLFQRQFQGAPYLLFLVCGLFAWKPFCDSLGQSVLLLKSQAALIRSIGFPKAVLPLSLVISNAVYFLVALVVPLGLGLAYGPTWHCWPTATWLLLPVVIAVQLVFTAGLALAVSVLGVLFQDTANILNHLLRVWLYLSPILYDLQQVPEKMRAAFRLNPFSSLLAMYRDLMIFGRLPAWHDLALSLGAALLFGAAGYLFFLRHEGRLVHRL